MTLPLELIIALLLVLLLGAVGWALLLRQKLATQPAAPPPSPTLFSPLFQAVASEFDAGIIIIDEERQVNYLNPQAEALLGMRSERALGAGLITILRDYQIDTLVNDVQRDGETREMGFQPVSGGRKLRLRVSRFQVDGLSRTMLLLRDITQLGMLERARRDLVANVSHELRNPLASVKLLVETLQTEPPPEVTRRMLDQMAQEVDAITQLVDELHELAQIESGRVALQMSPVELDLVITQAIDRIRPQAERKTLQVIAEIAPDLPLALIDQRRIGQVLLNLLHNAVKFTTAGGTIVVRAVALTVEPTRTTVGYAHWPGSLALVAQAGSVTPHQPTQPASPTITLPQPLPPGDWLLVALSDSGIGIPNPDLPRIFERFYKVDRARTRNAGGTGLGLAIAKHLIEGHGGWIWATSTEGVGSTFFFVLPVA